MSDKIVIILNDEGIIQRAFTNSNSDVEVLIVERDISDSTNCKVGSNNYVAQRSRVESDNVTTENFYAGILL